MKKIITTLWVLASLVLVHFGYAEPGTLEKIELVNMGRHHRVMIQCSGAVIFTHRYEEDARILNVYLRDAYLDAKARSLYRFDNGGVKEIRVSLLKRNPVILKIAIMLNRSLNFEIVERMAGVIYIELENGNTSEARNHLSESTKEPISDTIVHKPSLTESRTIPAALNFNGRATTPPPAALTSIDRISLNVKAAEVPNVLRLLSKQTNLNIVASKDVSGVVTVSLTDVTIKEALDTIVKANGLDYLIEGDIILIKPREKFELPDLETKVYRLKYIDANNLKGTVGHVLSPNAKIQVFYGNFNPTAQEAENEGQPPGQPSTTKKRSSILIITDTPEHLAQVDAMIEALDVPRPQIMIEAKLIEISPQSEEKLGINWSKSINAQIFREVLLPSGTPFRYSAEVPFTGGNINYGTLTFGEYTAVLDFLSSRTNSKLVSNPRILTMDNQEAVISVGTTFPIPQINRGVGGQGDVVTFEYRDVNIALRVTPHVSEDETITLYVNPEVEEVIGEVVAGENVAPITSKRTVETVVHLTNNETMVIGGLIRENRVDTVSKVWLLGDIPLIGNLFRHKNKSNRQTDLLIFITPRLVGEL